MIPLEEASCQEGEDVTFICQVSDEKAPVTWLKDGSKLEPSDKYVVKQDGTKHSLLIKNATLDDRAVYAVKVKDKESDAPLFVEGLLLIMIYQATMLLDTLRIVYTAKN